MRGRREVSLLRANKVEFLCSRTNSKIKEFYKRYKNYISFDEPVEDLEFDVKNILNILNERMNFSEIRTGTNNGVLVKNGVVMDGIDDTKSITKNTSSHLYWRRKRVGLFLWIILKNKSYNMIESISKV